MIAHDFETMLPLTLRRKKKENGFGPLPNCGHSQWNSRSEEKRQRL